MTHPDQPYITPGGYASNTNGPGGFGAPAGGSAPPSDPRPSGHGKKGKKGGQTKRVVNRNLVIAIIFGLVGALAVYSVSNTKPPVRNYVAVAKTAIPAGTPIDGGLLKAVQIDPEQVQPGAIVNVSPEKAVQEAVSAVKDQLSQYPMTENQQLVPDQFVQPIANLGKPLGPDERLVSFQASVSAAVAGSLRAGDFVDIYAAASSIAGLIVGDVQVVSVTVSEDRYNSVSNKQADDKNITPSEVLPGTPVPGTYVARVATADVAKIVAADSSGKIYLTYRTDDATEADGMPTSILAALCLDQPDVELTECKSYLASNVASAVPGSDSPAGPGDTGK